MILGQTGGLRPWHEGDTRCGASPPQPIRHPTVPSRKMALMGIRAKPLALKRRRLCCLKLLKDDEVRQIAANIAKLPNLLTGAAGWPTAPNTLGIPEN